MPIVYYTEAYRPYTDNAFMTKKAFCEFASHATNLALAVYNAKTTHDYRTPALLRVLDKDRVLYRHDIERSQDVPKTAWDAMIDQKSFHPANAIDIDEETFQKLEELVSRGFETSTSRALGKAMYVLSIVDEVVALGCTTKPSISRQLTQALPSSSLDIEQIAKNRQLQHIQPKYPRSP